MTVRARNVIEHLAASGNRVVRPRDLEQVNPRATLRRMLEGGSLAKASPGYYLIVPEAERGASPWRPSVEGLALGIAIADYGRQAVALMGCSAARLHGAIPRALATGVVAVPASRPQIPSPFGRVDFVNRQLPLDRVRVTTDVAEGWATSSEQTMLDLADRPTLGGVTPLTSSEAIAELAGRCDWHLVERLARDQRRAAAFARARWVSSAVIELPSAEYRPRRPVPAKGLSPRDTVASREFGVVT